MCIICVSGRGVRQPKPAELRQMFLSNPDGAGYMVAKSGKVEIHKGFLDYGDFLRSVKAENFTKDDVVIYHFRISTQAGVCPEMTHPFPLSANYSALSALDIKANVGIAHNGIIRLTSNGDRNYSDTALFIGDYMTKLIRRPKDAHDKIILTMVSELINSKMAILTGDGQVSIIGNFIKDDGLLFSNASYKTTPSYVKTYKNYGDKVGSVMFFHK